MRTVSEIMATSVQPIHRDRLISEAEGVFISKNISGAPIEDDDGKMVGFLSKTDIIRFTSLGEDPSYARVHEIASPRVVMINAAVPINQAAQKMLHEQVHHLVVMKGNNMVGVLSSFDFVKLAAEFVGADDDITENLFS